MNKPTANAKQKNGAVFCFPCEIGDTVYFPDVDAEDAIIRHKVIKLGAGIDGLFFVVDDEDQNEHPIEYFGKEVFLSEEEATKQYDKLIDGAKKAMQFFGFNAGDKLYIPERESENGDRMKFCFVTAIGSDEKGPFFQVTAPYKADARYKHRDIGHFFCLTEEEARVLWTLRSAVATSYSGATALSPGSFAFAAGADRRAKGVIGSFLIFAFHEETDTLETKVIDTKVFPVDGVTVKENIWYEINKNGELFESKDQNDAILPLEQEKLGL